MDISPEMYEYPTKKELKEIYRNLKWFMKGAQKKAPDSGAGNFVMACYSKRQYFGAEDYNDHRKDGLRKLRSLVRESILRAHQRGHYYDSNGKPVTVAVVWGYHGGYSGWFEYESGKNGFGG